MSYHPEKLALQNQTWQPTEQGCTHLPPWGHTLTPNFLQGKLNVFATRNGHLRGQTPQHFQLPKNSRQPRAGCVCGLEITYSVRKSMCRNKRRLPTRTLILQLGDVRSQEVTGFTWGHIDAVIEQKPACYAEDLQQIWFSLLCLSNIILGLPLGLFDQGWERRKGLRKKRGDGESFFFPSFSYTALTLIRLTVPSSK